MPTLRQVYERSKWLLEHGTDPGEKTHFGLVAAENAERVRNKKGKTRVQFEVDDPDLCSEFLAEKDRIIKRSGNKAVALSLMLRAWQQALADGEIDKLLAEQDSAEHVL